MPHRTPEQHNNTPPPGDLLREADQAFFERLPRGQRLAIGGTNPIYPAEEIGLPSTDYDGSQLSIIAEIGVKAPADGSLLRAAVVKQSYPDGSASFRIRGLGEPYAAYDGKVRRKVLDVNEDTPGLPVTLLEQTIGRQASTTSARVPAQDIWGMARVAHGIHMSRSHFKIQQEGGQVVITDVSTYGTFLRAQNVAPPTHRAAHTQQAVDAADELGLIIDGKYQGRSKLYGIIRRDTPVHDRMVDLRTQVAGGEAFIIDSTDPEYALEYQKLRATFRNHFNAVRNNKNGTYSESDVLQAAYNAVLGTMKYDLKYVSNLSDKLRAQQGFAPEVNIGQYLRNGKGVCSQMALASAWLLGDLSKHGFLKGTTTTGVNENIAEHTGHEWARYTSPDGVVYIVDPAQKFFGTLEDSLRQEQKGGAIWEYFLPGEKQAYLEKLEREDSGRAKRLRALGRKAMKFLLG